MHVDASVNRKYFENVAQLNEYHRYKLIQIVSVSINTFLARNNPRNGYLAPADCNNACDFYGMYKRYRQWTIKTLEAGLDDRYDVTENHDIKIISTHKYRWI